MLGSNKGRAEWTKIVQEESKIYGSGRRAEGKAAGTPVLSHYPIPHMPSFFGGTCPSIWHQPMEMQ